MAVRFAWQVYTVLVEPSRELRYCYLRCMTVDNAAIADDCEQPQSERGNALKLRGKKEKYLLPESDSVQRRFSFVIVFVRPIFHFQIFG